MSFVIGTGAAAGLICILEPVNVMLFKNSDGTAALQIFSASILFASLAMTMTAVLQGLGNTCLPAVFVCCGILVKAVLNELLIPGFGISGAAFATMMSFAAVAGLNFFQLKRKGWKEAQEAITASNRRFSIWEQVSLTGSESE